MHSPMMGEKRAIVVDLPPNFKNDLYLFIHLCSVFFSRRSMVGNTHEIHVCDRISYIYIYILVRVPFKSNFDVVEYEKTHRRTHLFGKDF